METSARECVKLILSMYLILQGLGKGGLIRGDQAVVAGEASAEAGNDACPGGVVVVPGEQGRPGGRAERRRVELGVLEALFSKSVQGGGLNLAATKGAGLPVARVVQHHQQNVGGVFDAEVLGNLQFGDYFLRVFVGETNFAGEGFVRVGHDLLRHSWRCPSLQEEGGCDRHYHK